MQQFLFPILLIFATTLLFKKTVSGIFLCYLIIIAICHTGNALLAKVYADFDYNGITVNYGAARGIGAIAYFFISIITGSLTERISIIVIPITIISVSFLEIVLLVLLNREIKK